MCKCVNALTRFYGTQIFMVVMMKNDIVECSTGSVSSERKIAVAVVWHADFHVCDDEKCS